MPVVSSSRPISRGRAPAAPAAALSSPAGAVRRVGEQLGAPPVPTSTRKRWRPSSSTRSARGRSRAPRPGRCPSRRRSRCRRPAPQLTRRRTAALRRSSALEVRRRAARDPGSPWRAARTTARPGTRSGSPRGPGSSKSVSAPWRSRRARHRRRRRQLVALPRVRPDGIAEQRLVVAAPQAVVAAVLLVGPADGEVGAGARARRRRSPRRARSALRPCSPLVQRGEQPSNAARSMICAAATGMCADIATSRPARGESCARRRPGCEARTRAGA